MHDCSVGEKAVRRVRFKTNTHPLLFAEPSNGVNFV